MANRRYNQFFQTMHASPVLLDCNFVIDSTNGNGLTSLKGTGISKVYCFSASPATGNSVPSGYVQVFFQDNFNSYFAGFSSFITPTSTNVNISSGLTIGTVYVITSVGTSTAANWQAVGLSTAITPAVGVSFIASTNTAGTGTGVVQTATATGTLLTDIEVVGNPNTTLSTNPYGNGYILLRYMAPSFSYNSGTPASSTVPMAVTQPANGSTVSLSFYLSNSSLTVQGE